ncbi:hypothetical protein [Pantoea sp. BAV 3049]|uniref:hypothetical protein n=1 Tax=Pantoea sp. BAV 3049 TaxID=2654188 RepID=UPI00131E0200|nr:hypothetical protein [Pantoea sp. BAV 3049]
MSYSDAVNFVLINGMSCEDRPTLAMRVWNACRAGVLRLNSGSKPFVVKRPVTKCIGWVKDAIHEHDEKWSAAVKEAGGEIAE